MNKSAILHIPMSQYAYGVDEEHVTIRLRTQHNDIETCTLYFGDRACRQTPVIFTEQKMEKVLECERYDYFEAPLEKPYEGAKEMLLVEEVDDRAFLEALFREIWPELPGRAGKR